MKRTIICILIPLMFCLPVLSFAASEIDALNSLPGSKALLHMSGGGCLRWDKECRYDDYLGTTQCTERCTQTDDNNSGGNSERTNFFEMDPLKAAFGLLIVAGLLYWILNIK